MFLPDSLWCGVDAVRDRKCFDAFGQFRNARSFCFARFVSRRRKPRFELITQCGQFRPIPLQGERLSEPSLVVAKLGLGDAEVLADAVAFGAIAIGEAFQSIEDGTRSLVVAGSGRDGRAGWR